MILWMLAGVGLFFIFLVFGVFFLYFLFEEIHASEQNAIKIKQDITFDDMEYAITALIEKQIEKYDKKIHNTVEVKAMVDKNEVMTALQNQF